jgi:predicted ATPase/DNA-binding SARP family transcriptional activator
LASCLWPESEPEQALYNLRRGLSDLKQAFGSDFDTLLTPTRQAIRLNRAGVYVDVDAFDAALAQHDRHGRQSAGIVGPSPLEEAIALYQGPLFEDCAEEWALTERRTQEQRYLTALQILAQHSASAGDTAAAIRYLSLTIAADPLREEMHRALMQALFDAGDIAALTRVYRDLRLLLRREVNADPSPETEALYRSLHAQAQQPSALAASPAPLNTGITRRLPVPLTSLVGREDQIADVVEYLKQGRLVTILGTGGLGKTRLAIAAGEVMATGFADGAWFVELASLSEPERVAQTVATTLGIPEQAGKPALETLIGHLASRALLLILDNCEHVSQSCALLADQLLPACPGVRLLATSRHPLGSLGERRYRLLPLEMPPEGLSSAEKDINTLLEYPGIRLFVDRAVMAQPRFRLSRQNAAAVLEICHALDGIPLAIELAASRLRAMDAERIAERLRADLAFLTLGGSSYPQRHGAMNAVIEWSYGLCSEAGQALFRRLSVFVDGCTLEAAAAVCAGGVVTEVGVVDDLTDLVDRSLVEYLPLPDGDRYRMLQPIQTFARAAFDATNEAAEVRSRYVAYFDAFVGRKLAEANQDEFFARVDEELDNLRAALTLCRNVPMGGELGLRLGARLQMYWLIRGHLSEGRERLMTALRHPGVQAHTQERADALNGAGNLAFYQGDLAAAASLHEESLTIKRERGNRKSMAGSLHNLGNVAWVQGDYAVARSLYEEALRINREIGNRAWEANNLERLGSLALDQGDYMSARSLLEECLASFRELGDKGGIGFALYRQGVVAAYQDDTVSARSLMEASLVIRRELGHRQGIADSLDGLGNLAHAEGDYAAARALHEESLAIRRDVGIREGVIGSLINLGSIDRDQGDYASARVRYEESLGIACETGSKAQIVFPLEALALLDAFEERGERAARLWGVTCALRDSIGSPLPPKEHAARQRAADRVRAAIGETAFAAAWEEGRAMTLDQAVARSMSPASVS